MSLANVFAAFTLVSIAASLSAMIIAGPRVSYAMAQDGLFFDAAARVHPRLHTPAPAIWLQAAWSSILVLSGSLSELVQYTGFAVMLFAGIAVAALFALRIRLPDEARPFRTLAYPIAPGFFVISTFLIVLNDLWSQPGPALTGLLVNGAGIPVYWVFRRHRNDG
jgi:APA family basic amino acid/polyamine antiporter